MQLVSLGSTIGPRKGRIQKYESYRPTRFMSRHKIDMECYNITSRVNLNFVRVVFVLVTAAEIQVAIVICVCYLDGVLDRARRI